MFNILKTRLTRLTASIVALLLLAGCSLLPQEEPSLAPPLAKPVQESYRTAIVSRGTIMDVIKGTATFEPSHSEAVIYQGQSGKVAAVDFEAGDTVQEGDQLVSLMMEGLELQLKEQELNFARSELAHKRGVEANLDEDELHILQLDYEIQKMKLQEISNQISNRQLVAPIDGLITYSAGIKSGDTLQMYDTVAIISDTRKLHLSFSTTDHLDEVKLGQEAKIIRGENVVYGKVVQTPSSAPQTSDGRLAEQYARTLYIELPESVEDAYIGARANVEIVLDKHEDVLMIPKGALRIYLQRTYVRLLDANNQVQEVDVEVGLTTQTDVEIIQGLEEGQQVILQ